MQANNGQASGLQYLSLPVASGQAPVQQRLPSWKLSLDMITVLLQPFSIYNRYHLPLAKDCSKKNERLFLPSRIASLKHGWAFLKGRDTLLKFVITVLPPVTIGRFNLILLKGKKQAMRNI